VTTVLARRRDATAGLRHLASDTAVAALVAGTLGGVPSTLHAIATGRDPLEAIRAAGTVLGRDDAAPARLLALGLLVHAAVSGTWALVLVPTLPRRAHPILVGGVLGAVIGGGARLLAARGFPRLAALPLVPQLADHAAYGALIGAVVRSRRGRVADRG
jgi:hypothetical protein